jgi:two-component system, chemotaxis family, response regulator WspF
MTMGSPGRTSTMRIAIVNGLANGMTVLRCAVQSQPGWQVAWEAQHGDEAVRLCARDTPDLILMDLLMPGANGAKATRAIMAASPCPILVVTTGKESDAPLAFEALSAGALDVVDCPAGPDQEDRGGLVAKIQLIARLAGLSRRPRQARTVLPGKTIDRSCLVAIGASAGGPAALRLLLEQLPATFPAPLVITQHLDEKFAGDMARWLSLPGHLPVEVARSGDRPEAGRVLLAGTNDHLVLRDDGRLTYTDEPTDQPYRPSVDEFFASAALYWPGPIVGVLLTGMGQDGARGLLALRRLGHTTFAQDQESSAVHGMPGTAVRFGAAMAQMNPSAIGRELVAMARTAHIARIQPKDT